MTPSLAQVQAAQDAWNAAEDVPGGRGPLLGSSYVTTIAAMLTAATAAADSVRVRYVVQAQRASGWVVRMLENAPEEDDD